MAIVDTLNSIKENITNAYNALEQKGASIPEDKNIQNLASAIESISAGEYNIESVLNEDGTQTLNITHKDYVPPSRVFSENTPSQIAEVSEQIKINNLTSTQVATTYGWNIGDTKDITLTSGETIQVRIIGVNHDNLSDGSGKAGLTLQMVDCLATTYPMNNDRTNIGGYPASVMKTSTLPTIKALLPKEWQDVIKLVDKKSANGSGSNYTETVTLSEDLFLLSEIELFGTISSSQDGLNEGSLYEYWNGKENNDRVKKYDTNGDGVPDTSTHWWLRSTYDSTTFNFMMVHQGGSQGSSGQAMASIGLCFAFCV